MLYEYRLLEYLVYLVIKKYNKGNFICEVKFYRIIELLFNFFEVCFYLEIFNYNLEYYY